MDSYGYATVILLLWTAGWTLDITTCIVTHVYLIQTSRVRPIPVNIGYTNTDVRVIGIGLK